MSDKKISELYKSFSKILDLSADEFEVYIRLGEKSVDKEMTFLSLNGIKFGIDPYDGDFLIPKPVNKEVLSKIMWRYLERIGKVDAFRNYSKRTGDEERIASYVRRGNVFVKDEQG